ncbi:hypothetical protein LZZ90_03935 [Flavobacterium sp. SM15]|uniref:hypothetical protein n=1 Tax=Flavobacterium sp. SM15 TaxID=2908005 RepID=UPI001EDBC82F|nr:hypothetical protein [Flavobacterium sp. SM15]MCG2610651.1 hypothetical protein [Flavobacterium sp. SM15]
MNLKNEYLSLTGDTEDLQILHHDENFAELALIFPNVNSIWIPRKSETALRKYVSKTLLKEIDPNVDVAVEKCLLVLSNFASTYHTEDKEDRWKRLNSKILHEQTKGKDNTYIYNKIIDLLKTGTATGAIIEVDEHYVKGVVSRKYRISDSYFKPGLTEYLIKDTGIIQTRNKIYYRLLNEALDNPICNNLVKFYPRIELPTSGELLAIGKLLVKDGYTTKKQKTLTMRNKHDNSYWADADNRSFVENNIKMFEYLTNRGFMIPAAGSEKSGGRVVDSFTLMPAWIRNEITIDGKKLVECDYKALHPNLAMLLYKGKANYLTHEKIAEQTGIDEKEVKREHLSFFNKNWYSMIKSPLFNYYSKHEPDMLSRIYHDKKANGYKITSKKMFKLEVKIMTDVIKYLNSVGIYVLYVYDALLCEEKDKPVVMETMNRIILEYGVKTCVKDTSAKIDIECAIVDDFANAGDSDRITLAEHFNRCKRKYRYVEKEQFDSQYEMLSEFFKYVDEVDENSKNNCYVEFQNYDGDFERIPLFE